MADTTNPQEEILYDPNEAPLTEAEFIASQTNGNFLENEVYRQKTKLFEQFVSNMKTNGYAQLCRFQIEFEVPNFSQEVRTQLKTAGVKEMSQRLIMNVESVDLPNRLLPTIDPRIGNFVVPFAHDYGSDLVQMQFRCGADMFEKKVIDAWQATAVSINTGNSNYPINYKRDIVIKMLNRQLETVYAVRLIGAFPSNSSAIALNHDSGELAKFNASFKYAWWIVEDFNAEEAEFPLETFKSPEEETVTADQASENRLAIQKTRLDAELKLMEQNVDKNADGESGNILDRIQKTVNKYYNNGSSITDGAKYFKSLKDDIEQLGDSNVLDAANKLHIGNGINSILSFLK